METMSTDEAAEYLLWTSCLPSVVAVALARRNDPDLNDLLQHRIDLCAEAWRVMLYPQRGG